MAEFTGAGTVAPTPALSVQNLNVRYGSAQAIFDVSFDLAAGRSMCLLGANGAGKSTLALALCGLVPSSGRIVLDGVDIRGWAPHRVRRAGIAYLPEGRGVFPGLTVQENLRMAALWHRDAGERRAGLDAAYEMFPILAKRVSQRAATLSGGEQQMLSLARGLMLNPKILIADEVSLGLAPLVVDAVFAGLARARDAGVTVILIEQFIHRALAFADNCVVLQRGEVGWSGPASEARDEVLSRYLGSAA
jgi:branched-chain amino acid transport system ATP-binding protein